MLQKYGCKINEKKNILQSFNITYVSIFKDKFKHKKYLLKNNTNLSKEL